MFKFHEEANQTNSDFKFDAIKPNVKVHCNYQDPYCDSAQQICQFFEQNKIHFELIQSQEKIEIMIN